MNYSKYGLRSIYNNEFISFSNLKFRLVIYLLLNPPGPLITWVQIILGCIGDCIREGGILLPIKLTTSIRNIEIKVTNQTNRQIIKDFYKYLQNIDTSENYQNGLLKVNTICRALRKSYNILSNSKKSHF